MEKNLEGIEMATKGSECRAEGRVTVALPELVQSHAMGSHMEGKQTENFSHLAIWQNYPAKW